MSVIMLRVTEASEKELGAIKKFLNKGGRWLMGHEVGKETEKPHIHIVADEVKSISSFRQSILNCLEGATKGRYSLKVSKDPEAARRYACKEGKVDHYGFLNKSIDDYREEYKTVREELKSLKPRPSDYIENIIQTIRKNAWTFETNKIDIHGLVYQGIPCPTDYQVISCMAKIHRAMDKSGAQHSSWVRTGDKF